MGLQPIYQQTIATIVALSLISSAAFANSGDTIKGVNYDPVHSMEFAKGMGLDNYEEMKTAIFLDLDRLAQLRRTHADFKNINQIKTYDSIYFSAHINPSRPQVQLNIAKVVAEWNTKNTDYPVTLALGVREFASPWDSCGENCTKLTQMEITVAVNAAIEAAKNHSNLINRIVVGNEDIKNDEVRGRLSNDITAIKTALAQAGAPIPVGTAQVYGEVSQMLDPNSAAYTKYQAVTKSVDFIGANIYPFWGGVAHANATTAFQNMWLPLANAADGQAAYTSNKQALPLIVTEEGWPSGGIYKDDSIPSPQPYELTDYFYYWIKRLNIAPMSYFFALFDRFPNTNEARQLPNQNIESYFGIFAADRTSSIIDDNPGKPFDKAKGHLLININNKIISDSVSRAASIYACPEDWSSSVKWQDDCYPLYGIAGPIAYLYNDDGADIKANSTRKILIDNSGTIYKSLLISYYDDEKGTKLIPVCHINLSTLQKLKEHTQITLQGGSLDGSCLI